MQAGRCGGLEWAVCSTAYPGQLRSGDAFLVEATPAGVLVAVVDGLGHGEEAADVAELALVSLRKTAGQPLVGCIAACDLDLRGSRGVVMTLALVAPDGGSLAWVAVGNVDAALMRPRGHGRAAHLCSVPLRGGVVGDRLPRLQATSVALAPGDTLLAVTDGLSPAVFDGVDLSLGGPALDCYLHRRHARNDDDALVFVGRWDGPEA